MMTKVLMAAFLTLNVLSSTYALAFPEFVRSGYFSCTSCHVSPAGGGMLTDYGRSFSAEKLATWVRPDEETQLHGVAPAMPGWLMIGGNFRQIQVYSDSARGNMGRWIAMQRDVDICVTTPTPLTAFACGTYGLLPPEEGVAESRYGMRKAMVRVDVGESLALRAGRFFPRFGLMIANHTAAVRSVLGFAPHTETDQVEATFMSEALELTGYYDFGRALELGAGQDELGKADAAYGLTAATLVGTASRLGLSYRHIGRELSTDHLVGAFAALGFSESTFLLTEIDQKASILKDPAAGQAKVMRGVVTHTKLGHEMYRGVVPAVVHETDFKDLTDGFSRTDTYGFALQWFPRPHFEVEAFYGHILQRREFAYASAGYLLMHYYL